MRLSHGMWKPVVSLTIAALLLVSPAANACTGIRITAKDGTIIYARTLEFGIPLESDIIVIPRGRAYVGTAPKGPGLKWTSKYGVVGANAWGLDQAIDGVNEKGLAGGLFYHPGYAEYPAVGKDEAGRTIASWEFMTWALSNFATVAEVQSGLAKIVVGNAPQAAMGFAPPVHAILHDPSGDCLVIEFVGGKVQTYLNPLGVITNAPTFDWHLTNLCNYINLSPVSVPKVKLDGKQFAALGQGSGMLGMPGDFTPPSRFVRAVAFATAADPVENGTEGVLLAHHVLSSFDLFPGVVRRHGEDQKDPDVTQWATFADLKNRAYYFRSYQDPTIRKVDLKTLRFDDDKVLVIPMHTDRPDFQDVTSRARILMR